MNKQALRYVREVAQSMLGAQVAPEEELVKSHRHAAEKFNILMGTIFDQLVWDLLDLPPTETGDWTYQDVIEYCTTLLGEEMDGSDD